MTGFASANDLSDLYVKTYGQKDNQAIIYVHGGPDYNSYDFELTTAPTLAQKGFFVVVYDQRGQGRSKKTTEGNYSYKTYADDIKGIIDHFKLVDPFLIGHSHGGPISIAFDQEYPKVAKKIVLAAAPVDFWSAMESLFENCARRYAAEGNQERLTQISSVSLKLKHEYQSLTDDERAGFVAAAFGHGLSFCKLYSTSNPTADEKRLRKLLKDNPMEGPVSGKGKAMPAFLKNENYVHKNFLKHVGDERDRYCGIYGDEDGLFTPLALGEIQLTLSPPKEAARFALIKGASHGIFLDQQDSFFAALRDTCGLPLKK